MPFTQILVATPFIISGQRQLGIIDDIGDKMRWDQLIVSNANVFPFLVIKSEIGKVRINFTIIFRGSVPQHCGPNSS